MNTTTHNKKPCRTNVLASLVLLGVMIIALVLVALGAPSPVQAQDEAPPAALQGNGRAAGDQIIFDDMAFRWCPPGAYVRGFSGLSERLAETFRFENYADELPTETVSIETGFWLGETEVTRRDWFIVMGTSPWPTDGPLGEALNVPVTHISWRDAVTFCERLSESSGRLYRLPTESEWEYAARAGTSTAYFFGDEHPDLAEYGWNWGNTTRVDEDYVREVAQLKPNPWGFYDILGNVWEFCSDKYGRYDGPALPGLRTVRGGSYRDYAPYLRSSSRAGIPETVADVHIGFRLLLEP